tara:strand:- start:688 stop:948 length:261 start_codon:yes stop_codon:yes gene_type:complete
MKINIVTQRENVDPQEIGLYLRLIHMEFNPRNNAEMAELISEEFNVNCTENDVDVYEQLSIYQENYERESRIINFGISIYDEPETI